MPATWKTTTAALTACVFSAALFASAATGAPKVSILQKPDSIRPGETATVALAVHEVSRCTLIAPGDRQTTATKGMIRVTFTFTVGQTVKPGQRWVIAQCTGVAPQRYPLIVLPPGSPAGTNVVPTLPAPATPQQRAARAWWQSNAGSILAIFHNGQCTDWASRKRPDIIERVEETAYVAQLGGKSFPQMDFIAKNWADLAKLAGMRVSDVPVAGALIVWQPGVEGAADEVGHVGYVESVQNGTFTTSEENVGAPYEMGSRTLSTVPVPGRLFIYP